MSRLVDPILGAGSAYAALSTVPMVDLATPGQFGWSPDLRFWLNDQKHVERNLKAVLLTPPKFITLMNNPEKWYAAIKNLVETHPMTIEGFNAALKPEFDDSPVGGGGEVRQDLVDMKRSRSEPVFTYKELVGRPIQNLLEIWMLYGMMDPDTKVAMVRTLAAHTEGNPSDWLADWYTMTCMFYTTDALERHVDKCWITTNMAPMEMGEVVGRKDLNSANELLSLSIPFTGISAYNSGTKAYAQQYHNAIMMDNANPLLRPSFINEIDPSVLGASNAGFQFTVQRPDLTKVQSPLV